MLRVDDNIYWTDALSGNLYTANLDSSALIISNIGSITTFNFYGLATDGVNIYFTDVTRGYSNFRVWCVLLLMMLRII